jgi:hypothetical protein
MAFTDFRDCEFLQIGTTLGSEVRGYLNPRAGSHGLLTSIEPSPDVEYDRCLTDRTIVTHKSCTQTPCVGRFEFVFQGQVPGCPCDIWLIVFTPSSLMTGAVMRRRVGNVSAYEHGYWRTFCSLIDGH